MKKKRWIKFLGGSNLIFTLVTAILLALIIMLYNQVSYFFTPLFVILSNIIAPAIVALLLYYLFNPVINFLESHKIKRIYGVILLYVLIIGLIVVGVGSLYPLLADQLTNFADDLPDFIASINTSFESLAEKLPFSATIKGFIEQGQKIAADIPDGIADYLSEGFSGLSKVVSSVTNVVVTIVIAPIMLFFLLKDDEQLFKSILSMTPPKWRDDLVIVSSQVNAQVGAYVQGQLMIATSLAVMMFIGLTIIGLEYNGILAVIAGVTSIVPYLGPIITFFPALAIAVSTSWWMVAKLLIVWVIVQFIDGNVVQPNIMGKQLAIHPLTIVIVLLVAGDLLGIVGLILGVPLYAILKVVVRYSFQQFEKRYNRYYGDEAGEYEIEDLKESEEE